MKKAAPEGARRAAEAVENSIARNEALSYAAMGYAVLPCLANKWPDSAHVPQGLKNATTDLATIAKWLAARPANWAILPPADVLVLDADGAEAAERLERDYAELQAAPRQRTPRGGAHFFLRWPEGAPPVPTRVGALPDTDIRGFGKAYVLVPPSRTVAGAYRWERPLVAPDALPVAGAALVAVLRPKAAPAASSSASASPRLGPAAGANSAYAQAALQREHDNVAAAPVGKRNHILNCAAFSLGQLVGGGALSREEVEDALLAAAATCGLPHAEAESTIQSGLNAGMLQPRTAPATQHTTPQGDMEDRAHKRKPPKSVATQLIELARERVSELWHTLDGEAYATIPVAGHFENHPLRRRSFRSWLERLFFEKNGCAANSQAVQDAIGALDGEARFKGRKHEVYTRLARLDGKLYLDLGREAWEVVEIDTAGWRVLAHSPVKFWRPKGLLPLPVPVEGGDLNGLAAFLNIDKNAWPLVVGWLLTCYAPNGPYPVLILTAEQDSGKSTGARLLRKLIDPNKTPLRSPPREDRDLLIAAKNGAVVMFDNVSHLPQWLSDAFCRLATGGGLGTRQLYTDDEEVLFDATRPLLLNGIDDLADSGDLLDRAIVVNCPPLLDTERRDERGLYAAFETEQPQLLGALLSAVSVGLRNLPHTTLPKLPRMADATLWITACEPGLGLAPRTFLDAYTANRRNSNDLALDVSPVPGEVRKLLDKHTTWEGTATELLTELDGKASDGTKRLKTWPKSAKSLGGALRRLAPNLRATGVTVEFVREGRDRKRAIRLGMQNDVPNVRNVRQDEDLRQGQKNAADITADISEANVRQTSAARMPSQTPKTAVADIADIADAKKHTQSGLPWDEV